MRSEKPNRKRGREKLKAKSRKQKAKSGRTAGISIKQKLKAESTKQEAESLKHKRKFRT